MKSNNRFYVDIMAMHQEVTGSCFLCVVKFPNSETTRFFVDCGMYQEKEYEQLNSKLEFNPENLDFGIVTHNHTDHIGRLPLIVKNGYYKPIYTSEATCELLQLSLRDSGRIVKNSAKRKNISPLYNDGDIEKTLMLLNPIKFYETLLIEEEHIKVTLFKNGHLPGAAIILLQISYPKYEDINILFTGDYNNKNIFFDVPNLPDWVLELPLTIIQESTYGYMNTDEMQKCFSQNIQKTINTNGTVVALVFSLGRAQEILYELKTMQQTGELDEEIPIYFDGKLAIQYTEMYLKNKIGIKEEMMDFLPENLTFVNRTNRQMVLENTDRKIIVTSSGMGTYGPAQVYIPTYIVNKDALIQFTGYTAEDTLGGRLKNTEIGDMVEIGGLIVKKRATVEYTTEFSAHAKADEMIDFLKQFKNPKVVLVNHGQTNVKSSFAERIVNEVNPKNVGLLGREYFFRISPYGLVKTVSTKFD